MAAAPSPYRRHRFPAATIRQAVYLYCRFTLSYRNIVEPLAARGIAVSYETIRRGFKSLGHAQRVLEPFGAIRGHFCPGRHRLTASRYRGARQQCFATWDDIACAAA